MVKEEELNPISRTHIEKVDPCAFETSIVYTVSSSPARAPRKTLVRPRVVGYYPLSHTASALRTTLGRLTEDDRVWTY